MTDQTRRLIQSLPKFAAILSASDRRGSAKWEIVRWNDIEPANVTPQDVKRLAEEPYDGSELGDQFKSRSEALEASAFWVRKMVHGYSERDHWGVWTWTENGHRVFQTVIPVLAAESSHGGNTSRPNQASTMVRLSEATYELLRTMAAEDGKSLQATADDAIREYDRQRYFAKADEAYQKLRNDKAAWAEELKERAELEGTLMDDIDTDEVWSADGTVTIKPREPQHA